jgi:hypothetical protein
MNLSLLSLSYSDLPQHILTVRICCDSEESVVARERRNGDERDNADRKGKEREGVIQRVPGLI